MFGSAANQQNVKIDETGRDISEFKKYTGNLWLHPLLNYCKNCITTSRRKDSDENSVIRCAQLCITTIRPCMSFLFHSNETLGCCFSCSNPNVWSRAIPRVIPSGQSSWLYYYKDMSKVHKTGRKTRGNNWDPNQIMSANLGFHSG